MFTQANAVFIFFPVSTILEMHKSLLLPWHNISMMALHGLQQHSSKFPRISAGLLPRVIRPCLRWCGGCGGCGWCGGCGGWSTQRTNQSMAGLMKHNRHRLASLVETSRHYTTFSTCTVIWIYLIMFRLFKGKQQQMRVLFRSAAPHEALTCVVLRSFDPTPVGW